MGMLHSPAHVRRFDFFCSGHTIFKVGFNEEICSIDLDRSCENCESYSEGIEEITYYLRLIFHFNLCEDRLIRNLGKYFDAA